MASGMKLQWTQNQSVRSPWVHGNEVMQKKFRVRSLDIRWSENGNSASKRLKVFSWSFPAKRRSPNHKNHMKQSEVPWLSYPEVFKTVTGSAAEKYVRTYKVWNLTFAHTQYEAKRHGQGDRWSQVRGVCEVPPLWCILSSHRRFPHLLDWSNTRSNKFLNEKKSKLNMFRLLGSSKPGSHWLACSAVSMSSNVHIFGKLGF